MEATTSGINVSIARMGRSENITVNVPEGSTVSDVFAAADMSFDDLDKDCYCEGVKAEGQFTVNDGDVLSIVADKVEAGYLNLV